MQDLQQILRRVRRVEMTDSQFLGSERIRELHLFLEKKRKHNLAQQKLILDRKQIQKNQFDNFTFTTFSI